MSDPEEEYAASNEKRLLDELDALRARVKALEEGLRAEHDRLKAEFDKGCQFGHSDAYHVDEYCGHCDPLHDRLKLIAALLAGPGGEGEGSIDGLPGKLGSLPRTAAVLRNKDRGTNRLHGGDPPRRPRM